MLHISINMVGKIRFLKIIQTKVMFMLSLSVLFFYLLSLDSSPCTSVSILTPSLAGLTYTHSTLSCFTSKNETSLQSSISLPLFNYRSITGHPMKTSYDEQYQKPIHSMIRPLPSSSMLAWNQCVHRLITEYQLTINALQQAKDRLEQSSLNATNSLSKSSNLVTDTVNNLSNYERKRPTSVTFCLPPSLILDKDSFASISPTHDKSNQILSPIDFSKPKLFKSAQLDLYLPSLELDSTLSIVEDDEKFDSINNVIEKFSNLNNFLPSNELETSSTIQDNSLLPSSNDVSTTDLRIHSKPSVMNRELNIRSDQCHLSSLSVSTIIDEKNQREKAPSDEKTIYEVETFYKSKYSHKNNLSPNNEHIVTSQESTTERQIDLVHEKQCREMQQNQTSSDCLSTFNKVELPVNINSPLTSSSTNK